MEYLTADRVDELIVRLEASAERVRVNRARQRNTASEAATRDLLTVAEIIRDLLQDAVKGDRAQLAEVFGGSCERFWRLNSVLAQAKGLSTTHAKDQRWQHLREAILTIQQVLKDLGKFKPFSLTSDDGCVREIFGGLDIAEPQDFLPDSAPMPSSEENSPESLADVDQDQEALADLRDSIQEAIAELEERGDDSATTESGPPSISEECDEDAGDDVHRDEISARRTLIDHSDPLRQFAGGRPQQQPLQEVHDFVKMDPLEDADDADEAAESLWRLRVALGSRRSKRGTTWYVLQVIDGAHERVYVKRYDDFRRLDEELQMQGQPGIFVPDLPKSGRFGFREVLDIGSFNARRKEGLEKYLDSLTSQLQSWSDEPLLAGFIGPSAQGQVSRTQA